MTGVGNLKIWGRVFERVRESRGLSITEMCYRARMGPPQYRVICYKLTDGPSVQTIDRLLKALDCTWGEWGATYDAIAESPAPQFPQPLPPPRQKLVVNGLPRSRPPTSPKPKKPQNP